jgi:hypothetical protein
MEQPKFRIFELEILDPLGGRELNRVEFFIAHLLLGGTADAPIGLADIRRRAVGELGKPLNPRTVKAVIRRLRRNHKLPILSSRSAPAGYWWCNSLDEMNRFIAYFRGVALDELYTLSQIVKHNYPALAGQLAFVDLEVTRNGNSAETADSDAGDAAEDERRAQH